VEVEVHLFANLADYAPPGARGRPVRVDVPEGATVGELLHRLRIPDETARLLLVNGHDADPSEQLHPDDVVAVLPPLVGG
jgi:molybdopterin converting factor small subunit